MCEICKLILYPSQEKLDLHMELVHNSGNTPLTEAKIEALDRSEIDEIESGPETPRKKSLKKYKLKPKKIDTK